MVALFLIIDFTFNRASIDFRVSALINMVIRCENSQKAFLKLKSYQPLC